MFNAFFAAGSCLTSALGTNAWQFRSPASTIWLDQTSSTSFPGFYLTELPHILHHGTLRETLQSLACYTIEFGEIAMALQFIANSNGWLSFNAATPSLFITAETDDFDSFTLKAWEEEGFKVKYIPFGKGGKSYVQTLHHLGGGMSIGERYAIVGIKPFPSLLSRLMVESIQALVSHVILILFSLYSFWRRCIRLPRDLCRAFHFYLEALLPSRLLPDFNPGSPHTILFIFSHPCSSCWRNHRREP